MPTTAARGFEPRTRIASPTMPPKTTARNVRVHALGLRLTTSGGIASRHGRNVLATTTAAPARTSTHGSLLGERAIKLHLNLP